MVFKCMVRRREKDGQKRKGNRRSGSAFFSQPLYCHQKGSATVCVCRLLLLPNVFKERCFFGSFFFFP